VLRATGTGSTAYAQVDLTTDVTGTLPVTNGGTGITSLGTGVATFLGTPTSANLAAAVTNETGSGALVFGTSPAITTPTGIVKGDVGLGNVDNTSDATKNAASVTLTNHTIDGSSNTLTNISSSSIVTGAWQAWSPSFTGFSVNPSGGLYYYQIIGKIVIVTIKMPSNGTSNSSGFTISLPVTAVTRTNAEWVGNAQIVDNGSVPSTPGLMDITSGGTTMSILRDYAGNAFTSSGGKRLAVGMIIYEAA
jgi:hypothetical protein